MVLEDGEDMDSWGRDRHRDDLNIPVLLLWGDGASLLPLPHRELTETKLSLYRK